MMLGWDSGTSGKSGRISATRGRRRIWSDGRQFGRASDEGSHYEVWMKWEDVLATDIYPLGDKITFKKDERIRKKREIIVC